jgi:hypothetical protein
MAGFTVHDMLSTGFEIEIKVTYREGPKYSPPESDEVLKSLTSVYARAFQEVTERLGHSLMVREV